MLQRCTGRGGLKERWKKNKIEKDRNIPEGWCNGTTTAFITQCLQIFSSNLAKKNNKNQTIPSRK